MFTPSSIRAVFFDLGGTLFHHLPPHHTQANLFECLPAGAPQSVIQAYETHRQQVEQEALSQDFFLHQELVAQAFQRTCQQFGYAQHDQGRAFCDAQTASVTQHLQLRDDTLPTLQALRARQYQLAIVSNIDDNYIIPLLERSGLADYVDFWISSERARSCKPHPEIFHQALAQAGVSASSVLFIGDSVAHDVAGAQPLGMATAWLMADQQQKGSFADANIDRLSDLLPLLP